LFWKDFPLAISSYDAIKKKLETLGANANFIDVDFPPDDKSIQE
jgi:hypothetical protein